MKGLGFCLCLTALLLGCANPSAASLPKVSAEFAVGARVYGTRCMTCHQADGSGTLRGNRFAADFTDPDGVLRKPDATLAASILNGVDGTYGRMPAHRPILSDDEVTEVLRYLRHAFGQDIAPDAAPANDPAPSGDAATETTEPADTDAAPRFR